MANIGDIVATATLDVAPFQQNSRTLKTYLRGVDQSLKGLENNMKSSGKTLGSMKSLFNQTGTSLKGYQALLDKQTDRYNKLKESIGDTNNATAEQKQQLAGAQTAMLETASKVEILSNKYSGLAKEIAIQESVFTKFGNAATFVGTKMTSVGDSMQTFGGNMTKYVTAPLTLGVGAVVKSAVSWESAFAGVKKTNDEVVDSNGKVTYSYNDLETGLRNMAKELPSSHQEIAAVAEAAGQLGIKTQDVTSFTRTMIDLGESTNLSAEEAASSIAKIANITGLTSDEYQRFGSSVVALGNNFATTERDIVALANRMAAAGTLAGLTNQEILGLATAMSSVGIEAEAGGTAMTQTLTAIESAAAKGGESLDQFAKVAGMSSEQFVKTWNEKPIEAVQSFIKGLGELDKKGESATMMLDEMGLSGVRQSNMLKSLALASETMGSAIDTSNKAWEENTALTNEAGVRYETTESKLKMLKNEAVDAAIDLGGPFVDALRDGLEASKPLIATLGDAAKAFSELDPELQRNIVKWTGIAMAAGPALKVLGMVTSTTGKAVTGIGSLSRSIGTLAGRSAEKKALEGLSTSILGVGTKAVSASGAGGIGAFTAALGGIGPVALGVVGAGGVLALGYGAWKMWGEEAWNAGQRTKRWGEAVSEATDTTLQKVQESTQKASGEFGLMVGGFDANSQQMIKNFQAIGQTIENDLTGKLEAYKQAVDLLPTELQDKANEVIQNQRDQTQKTLDIIQQNNDEVLRIKKEQIDSEGQITVQGAKMIQDLMKQSTSEYLKITMDDADARKEVMTALTGDIESASEQQAEAWIRTLGKQRQATKANYTEEINDYRKKLEATKQLSKEEIDTLVGIYEEARETSTDAIDAQMALIAKKYPELIDKVSFANGQLITEMGGMGDALRNSNKEILANAEDLADKLAENSKKNAKKLEMVANQATEAGKTWNSLELLDKEGNVKSNASEILIDATKDVTTWNKLKTVVHDANLSSNAKKMVGEAAVANGWWKGMAWDEKEAILEDEFSVNMYKALESSGKWDALSFEEKKAFLYSNTPEVMAETMFNLGLWEEFEPEIKDLKAENYEFIEILKDSEEKLKAWQETPTKTKELLADNYDFITKVYQSEEEFKRWQEIPDDTKELLASNGDLLIKLFESKGSLEEYNKLEPELKTLLADGPAKMTYEETKKALETYEEITPELKLLLGNDEDIMQKLSIAEQALNNYEMLNPDTKLLKGDNSNVSNAAKQGENSLNLFNANNPYTKMLKGDSNNVQQQSQAGENSLNSFNRNNPKAKALTAVDNASGPASSAEGAVSAFNRLPQTITKYLKVVKNFVGLEDGTNYHKGGPAVINDQKGPVYREFVQLPNGEGFIPEGRNVFLDLPRGSKVLKASKTKSLFPHYADGIGFENTKVATVTSRLKDVQDEGDLTTRTSYNVNLNNNQLEKIVHKLSSKVSEQGEMMIALLQLIANKELNISTDALTKIMNSKQADEVNKLIYGMGGV